MQDPVTSSRGAQGCPAWCLNDGCAESGDGVHVSATTAVPLAAGGFTMVELQQSRGEHSAWLYVVVEGHQGQPAVERRLTPSEARSVAAHLLRHADVAEGLA